MARISYVNGRFVNHRDAYVHIDDRGYQFADGVYEVMLVQNCVMIDADPHFQRLTHSLAELRIECDVSARSFGLIITELQRRNKVTDYFVYLQITRGVAPRNHQFPTERIKPSIVITLSPFKIDFSKEIIGYQAITGEDIRWKRKDIKSISLLPNILAKQEAIENDAIEIVLIDKESGYITECSASNFFIVDSSNNLRTHPLGHHILGGITRTTLITIARQNDLNVIEEPFKLEDVVEAKEAFITSTTKGLYPITKIDDMVINHGEIGAISRKIRKLYQQYIEEQISNEL
jgi:D-alanine transaminase